MWEPVLSVVENKRSPPPVRSSPLAGVGRVSLEDSSTVTELWMILRSCGPCVPGSLPTPGRSVPGAESMAVIRVPFSSCGETCCVAPVACVHSRKRPDPKGAGLSAARRVALEIETGDSTGAVSLFNCQSSSLHGNALPNPRERLPGPLSLGHVTTERAVPPASPRPWEKAGVGWGGRKGAPLRWPCSSYQGRQLVEHRRAGEW